MPNPFKTFIDTQRGKTTADKVAAAEAQAMGTKKPAPKKKKKPQSYSADHGAARVEYSGDL